MIDKKIGPTSLFPNDSRHVPSFAPGSQRRDKNAEEENEEGAAPQKFRT